ncbi:RNA polymerase sigma factor [Pseudolactococcus yaeyamensis]
MGFSAEELDELIESYADMVYRIAFVRMKNKSDAEDIFQEVFLRLVHYQEKIKDETHLKAWLIRVTINCCKKQFDLAWHKKRTDLSDYQFEKSLGNSYSDDELMTDKQQETTDNLLSSILKLPEDQKTILHLFYFEDYSVREISHLINLSESAVKTRLSRARVALKKKLEGGGTHVG